MSAVTTDHAAACGGQEGDAPLRLMAVHAHPDDESSKGAATMARYAGEGVDVLVCTLTGGERGDILNKAMERPEIRANLAAVRQYRSGGRPRTPVCRGECLPGAGLL